MNESLAELVTPTLVTRRALVQANIERMAVLAARAGVALRPHAKSHKTVEIARMQIAAGAIGVSVATVWEALELAQAGIKGILVTNQIVGAAKVGALLRALEHEDVTVAVDDARNVVELANAARAAGTVLPLAIEVDIGMNRCGVRSAKEALALVRTIEGEPGVSFAGVTAYEGHLMADPETATHDARAALATDRLLAALALLDTAGFRPAFVSAGGTGTYESTLRCDRVTELQPGSYALMDAFHESFIPGRFAPALWVAATVVSRHGSTVVLDAGRKWIGNEMAPSRVVGFDLVPRLFAEEHAIYDVPVGADAPAPGEGVLLVPGYTPTTVNLHEAIHVLDEGDRVTEVWSVVARGPSRR